MNLPKAFRSEYELKDVERVLSKGYGLSTETLIS